MNCEHDILKRRYDDAYYCGQCKVTFIKKTDLRKMYELVLNSSGYHDGNNLENSLAQTLHETVHFFDDNDNLKDQASV